MGWYPAAFIRSNCIRSWAACLSMRWTASPPAPRSGRSAKSLPASRQGASSSREGGGTGAPSAPPRGAGEPSALAGGGGPAGGRRVYGGVYQAGAPPPAGGFSTFSTGLSTFPQKSVDFPADFGGKTGDRFPPARGTRGCTPVPTAAAEPRRRPEGPACPAPAGGADAVLRRNRPAETAGGGAKVTVGWRVSPLEGGEHPIVDPVKDLALVEELHLSLGRVDVHIHLAGLHLELEHAAGKLCPPFSGSHRPAPGRP